MAFCRVNDFFSALPLTSGQKRFHFRPMASGHCLCESACVCESCRVSWHAINLTEIRPRGRQRVGIRKHIAAVRDSDSFGVSSSDKMCLWKYANNPEPRKQQQQLTLLRKNAANSSSNCELPAERKKRQDEAKTTAMRRREYHG